MLLLGFFFFYTALAESQQHTAKLCIQDGKVKVLETPTQNETLPSGCVDHDYPQHGRDVHLSLDDKSITGFERDWYCLENRLYSIDLSNNLIAGLTKEIFHNLPCYIRQVSLSNNKIEFILRDSIDKESLAWLDLSYNYIYMIETGALENLLDLKHLDLSSNRLTNVKFAASLPPNLKVLYLNDNAVTEIPDYSFSTLIQLSTLELRRNNITVISDNGLHGLPDSTNVDFSSNPISENKTATFSIKDTPLWYK